MSWGTIIDTWFFGQLVCKEKVGNKYFCNKSNSSDIMVKRWVIFCKEVEASRMPPEWHAWLHFTVDQPLTEQAAKAQSWQKTHQANLTGTPNAYRPKGHELEGGTRRPYSGDYEAWTPK